MTLTLDEMIERMEKLRDIHGGDLPVVLDSPKRVFAGFGVGKGRERDKALAFWIYTAKKTKSDKQFDALVQQYRESQS